MPAPIPIGVTQSFSNVPGASLATANFTMPGGIAVMTFQPIDVNNPGAAYLYDSDDTLIATLKAEGHETFQVPHNGGTYYFKATLGAKILAATQPSIWR